MILYDAWPAPPGTAEEHHRDSDVRLETRGGRPGADGSGAVLREQSPSLADDGPFIDTASTIARATVSPGGAVDYFRALADADVSDILSTIRVPTLLLYGTTSYPRWITIPRRAAQRRESDDVGDPERTHQSASRVATSGRSSWAREIPLKSNASSPTQPAAPVPDTVLATVLFTDVVGSTERAAEVGGAWRDQLAQHRQQLRREIARYGGREIDTAGDGFFIAFDGPARAIAAARAMT